MRAIILAGGKGKRLYPYTLVLPKPLIPIGELPIIEIVVRQLAYYGFKRITIAVGYHADLIMAVMGNGKKWGVEIDYSVEEEALHTIGPLTLIHGLDEPFLVMNGDLLTDLDYRHFYDYHFNTDAVATVATCNRHVKLSLGVVSLDSNNKFQQITSFQEKPEFNYHVSMGIYLFDPRIFEFIPKHTEFGFDSLMNILLEKNETIAAYPFQGHWLDMGTPDDLDLATAEFENNQHRYLPNE